MDSNQSKSIIIFTETYPYQGGEQFLINDYYFLANHFDKFIVFPQLNVKDKFTNQVSKLPKNIIVENLKVNCDSKSKINIALKNYKLIFNLFYHELIKNPKRIAFLKDLKQNLALFFECIDIERSLNNYIAQNKIKNTVFHAAWMNKYALVLSISKYKQHIKHFSFRVHGYDLFYERTKNNYLPFENFNYAHTNKVILNSKYSYDYKLKQTPFKLKLDYNYFSIEKSSLNPKNENKFHIVSCSNLIPLKRVNLIFNALKLIKFKIKWTHFGDGPEKTNLNPNDLPSHIEFVLKGNVDNKKIHDFYKKTPINLFIHTSETEGLGYAIFEALSFGIPCIACDAGGTKDLVNENTGKLLPKNISEDELAKEILNFKNSTKNSQLFKENVKKQFEEKYETKKLVSKLYNLVTS
jgi:glycosyltransferase involved in cell wall biosynthesis